MPLLAGIAAGTGYDLDDPIEQLCRGERSIGRLPSVRGPVLAGLQRVRVIHA